MHAEYLKPMIPTLQENIEAVKEILDIERRRFHETKLRTKRIVERMVQQEEEFTEEKMLKLYESEGITPGLIADFKPDVKIPEDFYIKVTEKHLTPPKKIEREQINVEGLPETKLLFYDDPKMTEFKARVLKMIDGKWVVLDQTAFYPEGGGQKADLGFIDNVPVSDTQKFGGVVVHRILGNFTEGQEVTGKINLYNREILRKDMLGVKYVRDFGSEKWRNLVHLPKDFKVDFIRVPESFVNKSLKELNIRAEYGVTILAVKKKLSDIGPSNEMPDPDRIFEKDDILVVAGKDDKLEKFRKISSHS